MDEHDVLIEQFEQHRDRLRAVSHRIVGSGSEADDAVQETWLRLARTDASTIENLGGWLTTVVARVSLDLLRARNQRDGGPLAAVAPVSDPDAAPEEDAVVAEGVGLAMLVVLDTLKPPERLAFVLHDLFGVPFDEIAPIVDRSPDATRQLASRARRRVRGASPGPGGPERRRQVIAAFLNASENGDFEALMALLDPGASARADAAAVRLGAPEMHGPDRIAEFFTTTARGAVAAVVDGVEDATWAVHGRPRVVFRFDIEDDRITGIELVADRDRLDGLEVEIRG